METLYEDEESVAFRGWNPTKLSVHLEDVEMESFFSLFVDERFGCHRGHGDDRGAGLGTECGLGDALLVIDFEVEGEPITAAVEPSLSDKSIREGTVVARVTDMVPKGR
ncbi:MAG: hypothetical protein WC314_27345 [Vulcanimicrobiota bacterium]